MKRWDRKMVRHFRYVAVRESRLWPKLSTRHPYVGPLFEWPDSRTCPGMPVRR
jgi:hypothetical protein